MTHDDLIELAQLCLKQAGASSNPVVAAELRRLANEYQARAAALSGSRPLDIAAAYKAAETTPVLQQQQPQPEAPGRGDDEKPSE